VLTESDLVEDAEESVIQWPLKRHRANYRTKARVPSEGEILSGWPFVHCSKDDSTEEWDKGAEGRKIDDIDPTNDSIHDP
jgi:hypothetical protein